jgi:hypothetical protein
VFFELEVALPKLFLLYFKLLINLVRILKQVYLIEKLFNSTTTSNVILIRRVVTMNIYVRNDIDLDTLHLRVIMAYISWNRLILFIFFNF